MMLEGDYVGQWEGDARRSRLVFVGRRLDHDALNTGFQNCRRDIAAPVS